jgi:hypothetical protein
MPRGRHRARIAALATPVPPEAFSVNGPVGLLPLNGQFLLLEEG